MNKLNSQKGFIVPVLIAVIAVLVAGGVYLVMKKQPATVVNNESDSATMPVVQTPEKNKVTVDSGSNTNSDWQIYSGSDYSIKYPQGWLIVMPQTNHDGGGVFTGKTQSDGFAPDLQIKIHRTNGDIYDRVTLATIANIKNQPSAMVSNSTITLNGMNATYVEASYKSALQKYDLDDFYILFQKGSTHYELRGSFEKQDQNGSSLFMQFANSLITN